MIFRKKTFCIFFISLGFIYGNPITSHLIQKMSQALPEDFINIYISLKESYDLDLLKSELDPLSKSEKNDLVKSELKAFYQNSQYDILNEIEYLKQQNMVTNIKALWISNVILCTANIEAINQLAERSDVRRIDVDEYRIVIPKQTETSGENGHPNSREITWNVTLVNADDVWEEGYTGSGVLVAVIDTGVNYNHTDLSDHVWNGGMQYPLHGYDFHNNDNNS